MHEDHYTERLLAIDDTVKGALVTVGAFALQAIFKLPPAFEAGDLAVVGGGALYTAIHGHTVWSYSR